MGKKRQVVRGQKRRLEKTIILIGTEGNNKTEKQYFYSLGQTVKDKYNVRFARGNSTDPKGIVEDTMKSKAEICTDEGDRAFAVFDTDADHNKQTIINEAVKLAEKNGVVTISSTPCFEVWLLQHFGFSTHAFTSNDEVIKTLRNYIPDYEKNEDVFPKVEKNTKKAIKNAKALEEFHINLGRTRGDISKNPSTDIYKIVEIILE